MSQRTAMIYFTQEMLKGLHEASVMGMGLVVIRVGLGARVRV